MKFLFSSIFICMFGIFMAHGVVGATPAEQFRSRVKIQSRLKDTAAEHTSNWRGSSSGQCPSGYVFSTPDQRCLLNDPFRRWQSEMQYEQMQKLAKAAAERVRIAGAAEWLRLNPPRHEWTQAQLEARDAVERARNDPSFMNAARDRELDRVSNRVAYNCDQSIKDMLTEYAATTNQECFNAVVGIAPSYANCVNNNFTGSLAAPQFPPILVKQAKKDLVTCAGGACSSSGMSVDSAIACAKEFSARVNSSNRSGRASIIDTLFYSLRTLF